MTNPLGKIAELLKGHPCEKIIKQTGQEIKISGAEVGIGNFDLKVGNFENKIKEFHKVTNLMVILDNSQYRLCTTIFKMNLDDDLKNIVNRIRLQIMFAFDQLQVILGSIEQNHTESLEKELEDWVSHMSKLSKRSIEMIAPEPEVGFKEMKKSFAAESYVVPESEPLVEFLDRTCEFQKIDLQELKDATKKLSE